MAGFDFVTEVSNETIRKLIMNNLQIGGVAVSPPFELSLPLGAPASGNAHLIVNDLQVDLNANDTITLTLSFDRTSVQTTAPFGLTVCPLDGTIAITAPVQLVSAGGANQQISVNLGTATVAINWSAAATQNINQDLAGTGLNAATFTTFATQALTGYVHSVAAPALPMAFRVVPGTNGSIAPSLQFEKLEVHCIPNANRSQQALGIFGILLAANHSHGNHAQKTATAITAAHDGMCISIAPGAFHSLVFCPAIATALSTDVPHLPGSCGPASSFETGGVSVNSITDSFANGHIDINGAVSKSGFCYDATGTFHGALTLSVSGSTLNPSLTMDDPNVDVSIPWYCYVAAGVVLGPIGLVLAGVADAVADGIVSSLAGDAIRNALGSGIPGIGLGALSAATFSSASITPEGLTLQGTVPVFVSHPSVSPALHLNGSVITNHSEVVSSGVFHAKVWCMPDAKDYPYSEYVQQQAGVYSFSGTMVSQPLTPQYTINASGGPAVPLTGTSGTIALPNVNTHYPMPLATGGTALVQTVHISYTISGTSVQLTNVPSEGNYSIYLNLSTKDCAGNTVQNEFHHDLTTWAHLQFEGDKVDIGGGYAQDVQTCAQKLKGMIDQLNDKYKVWQRVPKWQQVNYPAPERMIEYIRDLVATGLPQADEILLHSKIAHGSSFYRALFAPAAKQPALLKANLAETAGRQQLTDVAQTLLNLSQQLLSAGTAAQQTLSAGSVTLNRQIVSGLVTRKSDR
jgi:hypothetical protein